MKTRKNTNIWSVAWLVLVFLLGAVTSCKEKEVSYDEIIADFLFEYTPLTAGQVQEAVDAGPSTFAGSEQSPGYVLLLDDSVSFAVPEGSACLRLNDITLNVWREPQSLNFFVAVVDERTQLATVFETWLCGEGGFGGKVPPREMQRHISTGHIAGQEAPEHLHKATRRLTGKVIQWSDELTLFGSATYSARVPEGSMQTFCYPSDYYELDDRHWLYSRVEVEFSGEFVLDLIDLYTMKKIGVKFGIDAQDKFGCALYSDAGKIRGQLAAYYPFGLTEARTPALPQSLPLPLPKGVRYLYRPSELTHPMTIEEVVEVASRTKGWKGAFDFPGKEKKMMEHSTLLDNRSFSLVFDNGVVWEYEIGSGFQMRFRPEGGEWKQERYDAFEADDQLVFFTHTTDNDCPIDALQYAIDLKNGLVTCIRSTFDNAKSPRDPRQQWLFGVIKAEGIQPSGQRHGFTDELLGHSYTWEYSDDISSQHVYTTTESFTYAIISSAGPSVMGSFPCKYVKIRDGVYMLSWIEMRSQGIQGILLFNTKTMHDCGTCHGLTHDQTFEFNTFGAESRGAGRYY
ncbi:MAG: molybdenum cofactor biosynthesis F family protein [Tannerellaceae bacterium]|jgi:hypothetical protein|nr:molybdenum cofactor biosynthesis F family protein [Tannerellaceae bacterium]